MTDSKQNKIRSLRSFFHTHQTATTCLAVLFIFSGLLTLFFTFSKSIIYYSHLQYRTGTVIYWHHTGGKYNTATLEIKGDSIAYTTVRYGGWACLQHNGKKGENVIFYAVTNDNLTNDHQYRYFGLSNIDNPRLVFWIFMDVLCYSFSHVIFLFLISVYGLLAFNWQFVNNRAIKYISLTLFAILMVTFGLAVIS